jgi:hypothetical protein
LRATLLAPSPEALESYLPALEETLHDLQRLQQDQWSPGEPGQARELRINLDALAKELRAVANLIQHGMAFQQGWSRLLAGATGGYRPDGEPRPLQAQGSISVRG